MSTLNDYLLDQRDKKIAELESENSTLHRMLASQPDKAMSTGAAQAAMEYQVEIRDKRIAELEAELAKAHADRQEWRSRMGLKVLDDIVEENTRLKAQVENTCNVCEGTPSENNMVFCCKCGKPLVEHPYKEIDK